MTKKEASELVKQAVADGWQVRGLRCCATKRCVIGVDLLDPDTGQGISVDSLKEYRQKMALGRLARSLLAHHYSEVF